MLFFKKYSGYKSFKNLPYKSLEYISKKYLLHPIYNYDIYLVIKNNICESIIITRIVKLIGIAKATIFPNKVPVEIESPIIIVIPVIAITIDAKPTNETFSLKKKKIHVTLKIIK